MLLKRGPLRAGIDVYIRYTFEPVERGTLVIRELDLTIEMPDIVKLAMPLVLYGFRKENVRMMAALKRYVEVNGGARYSRAE
jgi:hypothetical protein